MQFETIDIIVYLGEGKDILAGVQVAHPSSHQEKYPVIRNKVVIVTGKFSNFQFKQFNVDLTAFYSKYLINTDK